MSSIPESSSLSDVGRDVQEQIALAERRLHDLDRQTRRLQKLAAMGTMSAMLAHEFRNLLTPIVSYAQYAISRPDDLELARTALEMALKNARAAAAMCERITDMASDQGDTAESANVLRVVQDSIACLGRGLDRDAVTLDTQVPPDLSARISPVELQQVVFNLVLNARQAMLDRAGTLRIVAQRADDGNVRIEVSDTGTGIRTDDLAHVFDPFFTTKRSGESPDRRGLGLGLTICRQMIEEAGGAIQVQSRWGEGTTFTIIVPEARANAV